MKKMHFTGLKLSFHYNLDEDKEYDINEQYMKEGIFLGHNRNSIGIQYSFDVEVKR